MKSLLFLGICCLLFLVLTETMARTVGVALLFGAVIWLIILLRQEIRSRKHLASRRAALQARWAISIWHLNGLPLPVDTTAILFLTSEMLILEAEQESWTIGYDAINKVLLISSEMLRHISDRQLCRLLHCEARTFFALREKLRHHNRNIHHASILLITYMPAPGKQSIWVLFSSSQPQAIAGLLNSSSLREKTLIQLRQKKAKPVKQPGET